MLRWVMGAGTALTLAICACGVSIEGADDSSSSSGSGGLADATGNTNQDGGAAVDDSSSDVVSDADAGLPSCTLGDAGTGTGTGHLCAGDNATNICVDLTRDRNHCGTCTTVCGPAFACEASKCVDVATAIQSVRVELPCQNSARPYCSTGAVTKAAIKTIAGSPGITYAIAVRVRGVVEQKSYDDTLPGNANGFSNPAFFTKGGDPDTSNWNLYAIEVSDPPMSYRLNDGSSGNDYCDLLDYTATIVAKASAVVTLKGVSQDQNSAANRRNVDGNAIVIAGIPPAPAAFDGQFVQMDVVSVTAQ